MKKTKANWLSQIDTGFRSLKKDIDETRKELAHLEQLGRNSRCLYRLRKLVKPGPGFTYFSDFFWRQERRLPLVYIGQAKTEEAAQADLSQIAKVLKGGPGKLEHTYGGQERPYGYYQFRGKLGRLPVEFKLHVSWMPPGCTAYVQNGSYGRRWHRQYEPTTWGVVCRN